MSLSISNSEPFWPKPLITATLVLVICGLKLLVLGEYFDEFWTEKSFWANRVHDSSKYDVVFCGDSRTYRSIDVESLVANNATLSAMDVTNKGFSAAGLRPDYLKWAAELLEAEGPRVLVLGVTVQSLSTLPAAKDNTHFKESGKHLAFRIYLWLQQLFHRNTTHALLRNKPVQSYAPRNRFHSSGWVEAEEQALIKQSEHFEGVLNKGDEQADFVAESDVNELFRTLAELRSNGVRVFAFRPPAGAGTDSAEERRFVFNYSAFVVEGRKRGIEWLEVPDRDSFQTYDGSHLTSGDAKKLSRVLGRLLDQAMSVSHETLNSL